MPIKFSRSSGGGGIPSGSSNDRPENPSIGDQFYNGTLGVLEIYSNAGWVPSTGANDFNVSLSATETSVTFDRTFFAGSYTISSSIGDNAFDTYLFAQDGSLAGYSSTPSITASQDFNRVVIIGGTANDLLAFAYKVTYVATLENDDFSAPPYINQSSEKMMPNANATTILTGGNFSTGVQVFFVGSNGTEIQAKSVVRNSATEIVVTRPDSLPVENAPYSLKAVNPGVSSPVGSNRHKLQNSISPTASGGTVTNLSGYRIHTFYGSGTFSLPVDIDVEYLIIGGGGAGGTDMGGGGGAGGYLAGTTSLIAGSYPITIGAGGTNGTTAYNPSSYAITSGNNTSAFGITSIGGGYGACGHRPDTVLHIPAAVGGSGGGASGRNAGSQRSGTPGQGNGGGSTGGEWYSGGGGGSSASGSFGGPGSRPDGGAGTLNAILGTNYYWAAGGGGGGYSQSSGFGGIGGGGGGAGGTAAGSGGSSSINSGSSGAGTGDGKMGGSAGANTGSGGGGGAHNVGGGGGSGGSGIVIIKYRTTP